MIPAPIDEAAIFAARKFSAPADAFVAAASRAVQIAETCTLVLLHHDNDGRDTIVGYPYITQGHITDWLYWRWLEKNEQLDPPTTA